MNKLICLLFGIALLFSSCIPEHHNCCVLPAPVVITAQKNGEAWQLPIIKSTVVNDNISISTAGPYLLNTAKDSLSINLLYTGLGNYSPTDAQVSYTVFSNGVKTKYLLDTNFYNSINITKYEVQRNPATTNPDPTVITATFNLRFVDPQHSTSVSLSNGKFTAYLSN